MKKTLKIIGLLILLVGLIVLAGRLILNAYWSNVEYVKISKNDEALGITEEVWGVVEPETVVETTEIKKEWVIEEDKNKYISQNYDISNSEQRALGINEIRNSGQIINIALYGVDSREVSDSGRSDAMIVLSIDLIRNKIKLMSFMRDMYVPIEGYGKTKLGHAYAYGGAELAVKTFNQDFGLDIREFATTNFYSLAEIVDILGGLDITITEAEQKHMNTIIKNLMKETGVNDYQFLEKSGTIHMNGAQVVTYARIRKVGNGDYERTDRQREVLNLMFEKIKEKNPTELLDLSTKFLPLVATSLDSKDIVDLIVKYFSSGSDFTVESIRFPVDGHFYGDTIDGASYIVPRSMETLKEQVQNYVYFDLKP